MMSFSFTNSVRLTVTILFLFFISQTFANVRAVSDRQELGLFSTSKEEKTRRNIGAFFNKLRAGKAVTVAYLGGAATVGPTSDETSKNSYRAQVTNWLRRRFPGASITEINAGVAGTGSLYAALRARRDVIAFKPDLVFVELAAGDASEEPAASEEAIKKAIEGVLRQLLIVPQPPEVVLLYATNAKRNTRADWHETIAAHYQIPAINLQERIWTQIDAGQATASALWKDGQYATEECHKLYASFITAFLAEQEKLAPTPIVKNLPQPFTSDELNYGEAKSLAEVKHDAMWRTEPSNDRTLPAALLTSDKAGVQIEIFFEGTVLGLTFRAGPDGGLFECLIDGKPAPAPLNRIDAYDTTHRLATRIIPGGLTQGEHKLTIRALGQKNPKSSGHNVRLGSLLVGGQRPERL